ncbi:UBX domain-containing protein 1-like isoform X2 [Apostichopus japonicus]|uniref:UBX domain-containing protein 1-like isoform X2 n=1 Tax=Stichopus japonicus TaxID=307972 RepID=UPI003AB78C28
MSSNLNILLEMGFSENRAKRALTATQYKGIQEAIDWIGAHENDPSIDDPFVEPQGHKLCEDSSADGGGSSNSEGQQSTNDPSQSEAKSLKCDDCGKLIKSTEEAEMHAARTSHQNFSESTEEVKPLTEDERKQQMDRLQEKIKLRQQEKKALEKKEAIEKEKLRRKQGKQLTNMKQQMETDELMKIAEQKRREKLEDKLARKKVKDQIAQDKADRAARFGKTAGTGDSSVATDAAVSQQRKEPAPPAAKKEYNEARIQIRLTDGTTLKQTFSADEQLSAIRLYVEMNRSDGMGPFTFMTTFPRKVFTSEDMETPLKELGLIPSAVLVTKPL